ncbi:MAG: hypothetical protein DRI73_00785 [Bacteroidetes bacterium]|nr:MAG: hypothetical protein DRI73_00785 [Bacteroidota bacterium]
MRSSVIISPVASLLILSVFFFIAGQLLIPQLLPELNLNSFYLTLSYFLIVNILVLFLFFKGSSINPEKAIIYTLLTISLKFILYISYILIYYLITKNLSKGYLIIFFVLYLAFSFFTLFAVLKELKLRSK